MNTNVNMNKMSSGVVVVELGSDSPKAHNEMPSSNDTSKLASEKTTMKRWVVSSSSSREGGGSQPKRKVLERMKKWTVRMHQMVWKVGKDDPRRVVHSIKVGLSLTLLSLIYLLEPLFQGIGQNAIWAVLFVILIFEFTAGTAFSILHSFWHCPEPLIKWPITWWPWPMNGCHYIRHWLIERSKKHGWS